jgi:PKD repeat protein
MILSQGGFKMMVIPKSSITGMIDFTGRPLVPLTALEGFMNSGVIWPEVKEFQTTPVGGINFASAGPDSGYRNLLRHTSASLNPGNIALRVQLPNGNEKLAGNHPRTMYWYRQAASMIDTVRIDFSPDGGSTWTPVSAKAPNSGSYAWTVPPTASTNCLVRVGNAAGGTPADTSDAPFTIEYISVNGKPPVAQITRPTRDTTVYAGETMTFRGTASDSDGYIMNYVWRTGDGRVVNGIVRTFDHVYATAGTYYATLEVVDNDTLWSKPDSVVITVLPIAGVGEDARVPEMLMLHPNYPNPFNGETVISYSLDRMMNVRLRIFSITGEEVVRLVDEVQAAGMHRTGWDARNKEGKELASGLYICRLETPEALRVQKILLLR